MPIHRLNHAVLYVRDTAASVPFYRDAPGFAPMDELPAGRRAFRRAGGPTPDLARPPVATRAAAGAPPTIDELRADAKGRLDPFKVPKSIEIVTAIPRSAATKVNRGALLEARGG